MKHLLRSFWAALSSRATSPLVIGVFLLIYIGIAFFTDDALIALVGLTHASFFLTALLALLPLNSAARIVTEAGRHIKRRRVLTRGADDVPAGLFDETVDLSVSPSLAELQSRLGALGYHTRHAEKSLVAWRGFSIFPARMLFIAGTFCLFAGIVISISSRTTFRGTVIEGEPFPAPSGNGGIVERITLEKSSGLILAKHLFMEVGETAFGAGRKIFGVYPPSRYRGAFVYPRYLGIDLHIIFSAPDLPAGYETHSALNIYLPGREASTEIPGSPYRLVFSLARPDDGSDPYMTGRMVFLFKLLKGKEVIVTGSVPSGGEFAQGGYRLALPDSRRLVITDLIRDHGVLLIWTSGILFVFAGCFWLPVRIFFPRREMLFRPEPGGIRAFSRAEGRGRRHGGVFHEMLDLLETRRTDRKSLDG